MPVLRRWAATVLAAALCSGCRATPPPVMPYDFTTGEGVIRAMHDRYFNRWYENLTFVQHNRGSGADTAASVWLTAVSPPRRMRIDFEPRQAGNGVLILRDTQYVMVGGRARQVLRAILPLVLLQHDVYFLTPTETIARLNELGFDLGRVREESWDGRPVYAVGAADARARQFWVDRELMLLVRMIEPSLRDPSLMLDTRLLEYERLGAAWVPRRIEYFEGGTRTFTHELRQIRANTPLDSLLFRPDDWMRARHWYQQAIIR